jgi:tetratricopeptide (TPR) repeat protein
MRFERADVNLVYAYQVYGSVPNDRWISTAGRQLAELAWLASTVFELRTKHVSVGNLVLDQLPAFGSEPLMSFNLRAGIPPENQYLREPDYQALATLVVGATTEDQLKALIENWWAEAEAALRFLQKQGHGPVRSPCSALHEAMQAVIGQARQRFPALNRYSADALQRRGIALTRFHDLESAIGALTEALDLAEIYQNRVYAARAVAYAERGDLALALKDMDAALACAENAREECVNRFTRAVYRAKLNTPDAFRSAIDDYDRVIELSREAFLQIKALNYRASMHRRVGNLDAALADWKAVIDRRTEAPRAAAQACLNRAGYLRDLGRLSEAHEALTTVLEWADLSSKQRFRALEARAGVRERLGDLAGAATDIEALLALDMADPEWRPKLREKARSLREAADNGPSDSTFRHS